MPTDPVDVILDFHGIAGPWKPLKVTGAANRIYATEDIVLRIATEHPDAVLDAHAATLPRGLEIDAVGQSLLR